MPVAVVKAHSTSVGFSRRSQSIRMRRPGSTALTFTSVHTAGSTKASNTSATRRRIDMPTWPLARSWTASSLGWDVAGCYIIGMTDVSFDMLGTLDQLKAEGFSDGQARVLTERLQKVSAVRQSDVATKAGIAELRTEMKAVEQRLGDKVSDQFRWLVGILAVGFSLLFAGMRLF